jgi:hypothetical protein
MCAVCARHAESCLVVDLSENLQKYNLELLWILDPFIIQHCIVQCLSASFSFHNEAIDGLMLDRGGVQFVPSTGHAKGFNICSDCRSVMFKCKIPQLALANHLYHGSLPDQFADLTWVEEKVCAVYCITVHVTCLFQSSDPTQPRVFHSNTCAHEMNTMSTATVLHRTPSDVNGFLSVMFIGPKKFDLKRLGSLF